MVVDLALLVEHAEFLLAQVGASPGLGELLGYARQLNHVSADHAQLVNARVGQRAKVTRSSDRGCSRFGGTLP